MSEEEQAQNIEVAKTGESGQTPFERIRHSEEAGREYWSARELAEVLGYKRWDKFKNAIQKAKLACQNSGNEVSDHFSHVGRMVKLGSGAQRQIEDVELTRYACYLVVENADPGKPIVALGQTYFASQTRKAELEEEGRRVFTYDQLMNQTAYLKTTAAGQAGIIRAKDFAIFQDYGYRGLYGGETSKEIAERKGLKPEQAVTDYMGRAELAANLFRASQAEQVLLNQGRTLTPQEANDLHHKVGAKVRQTIQELGGLLPEKAPTPTDGIKTARKRQKGLTSAQSQENSLAAPNETEEE